MHKKNRYKAIIFDMDGTIVDTNSIWHEATAKLIDIKTNRYSKDLHEEILKYIHGMSLDKVCGFLKQYLNISDSVECLIKEKSQIALSLYTSSASKIKFIEGFPEFHEKLKKHNLKFALATNADNKTLDITNKILNLNNYFSEHLYNISFVDNRSKPNPDIYLFAAKKLGVEPENCIAIEDSVNGIQAALNAGMYCIGINTAKDYEQVKKAHKIVDRFDQINLEEILN